MNLLKHILYFIFALAFLTPNTSTAQSNHGNKFEQIDAMLPSPNRYRSVDGQAGPDYWQQKVDYSITCELNTLEHKLEGEETITYHNNSDSKLSYLWLQLDENEHKPDVDKQKMDPSTIDPTMGEAELKKLDMARNLDKYGFNIRKITDANGKAMDYVINQTMLRLDLAQALEPGQKVVFNVKWDYYLVDRVHDPSRPRGGYEFFEKDGNYLYTMTQWYPRLCAYTDYQGWQNNQFTGRGEFALQFGDFDVKMTLPTDFMVGSTGECQNYDKVLTSTQKSRWKQAQNAKDPIEIVTLDEAKALEKAKPSTKKQTWHYKAENVRDFAWTASRKYVWDAMPYINENGKKVMCMSYYGKEAYPIYNRFSTRTIVHTLRTYSKYSFPYPYPVSISVEAANGMEYPMICFNPGRAEEDGTYDERQRDYALLVIIHEVGHNYFPMIVNSDERQWAWFDEGINSFMQYVTESEFSKNYKHRFTAPAQIADYMALPKDQLEPIMTNTENIVHYGSNAYDKPSAALTILRETIMGRELFDYAFKEYCERWMFKHPTPMDFFRTMEDASGVDLDWFWKGWFYTVDAVDISMDSVQYFTVNLDQDPQTMENQYDFQVQPPPNTLTRENNIKENIQFADEIMPELVDFYTTYRPWETDDSIQHYTVKFFEEKYTKKEKKEQFKDLHYYQIDFTNRGGLVMPIILEWSYVDGTTEIEKIPAMIWRKNENNVSKVFVKDKRVARVRIDPRQETADIDEYNNEFPVPVVPKEFLIYKEHEVDYGDNPMQRAKKNYKP